MLSLDELVGHGEAMREHGWTVTANLEGGEGFYTWTSPRGEEFKSDKSNVPSEEAVSNATQNCDYECTLKQASSAGQGTLDFD